jgi:hypothetical protein
MSSFIELSDVVQAIACPGCGSSAAVGTDPNRGESELYYRLNTLVDRASDNGVMVHLLAAAALRRRDPKGHVNPGVNLIAGDGQSNEADLLALLETDIWLGEAKTSRSWFTTDQIARDVALANRTRAAHYLMTCLMPLDDEVKREASMRCEQAGIRLWVLEGAAGDLVEIPSRS